MQASVRLYARGLLLRGHTPSVGEHHLSSRPKDGMQISPEDGLFHRHILIQVRDEVELLVNDGWESMS